MKRPVCFRCGERPGINFLELYNPRDKFRNTCYLCDECQARVCDAALNTIQEGWT